MKYWQEQDISTHVTGHSLIGTGRSRPVSWGNYCWVAPQIRVLNMWAENIETATVEFKLGDTMKAFVHENSAVVIDPRIPETWKYNKLCFTGGMGMKTDIIEAMREIYEYLGDPTGEFEQFTDPVKYWRKRNANYNPKTHIIAYRVG